jgi:hypothetical protein
MGGSVGPEPRADLELVRVSVAPEGAFGVLLQDGVPLGPVTIERSYPVAASMPRSLQFVKIPPGRYRCKRTRFLRGGYDTFEITGVVGHDRLLFHAGNSENDSEGCVLVGQRFGRVGPNPGVLSSRMGFAEFMQFMGRREVFELLVRDPSGGIE